MTCTFLKSIVRLAVAPKGHPSDMCLFGATAKQMRTWPLLCVLAFLSLDSTARGGDYQQAIAPRQFSFPRDHGRHDGFKIEWWYFTGNLVDSTGKPFGYQLTFFRSAMAPKPTSRPSDWATTDLYFAHAAVTDVDGKRFAFKDLISRGRPRIAEASDSTMNVNLLDWSCALDGRDIKLSADDKNLAIHLDCKITREPFLEGPGGVNKKGTGPGQASYYYSITRLLTSGTVSINGQTFTVTGQSWMDHEFSSDSLGADEVGWDWMGLQLDNGTDLMIYRLRGADGSTKYLSGTRVGSDGVPHYLSAGDIQLSPSQPWQSPRSSAKYPLRWEVRCGGISPFTVTSLLADQELSTHESTDVTYYEGAADVGDGAGKSIGRGYLEMTGYAKSINGSR